MEECKWNDTAREKVLPNIGNDKVLPNIVNKKQRSTQTATCYCSRADRTCIWYMHGASSNDSPNSHTRHDKIPRVAANAVIDH